jgi:hypothetical protein
LSEQKELNLLTSKKSQRKQTVIPISSTAIWSAKKAKKLIGNGVFGRIHHKKENKQHVVYQKYKCDMMWCLLHLSPHTSSFGVQPYSELLISVDHENGIYIGGYGLQDNYATNKKNLNEDIKFNGILNILNSLH